MTSGCPFSFLLGKWPTADLHVYHTIEDTNHSKIVFIFFSFIIQHLFECELCWFFFHYSFNCINQTYCNKTFCILIFSWIVDFRFSSPRRSRRRCSDLVFEAGHVSKLSFVLSLPDLHEWCIWTYLWTLDDFVKNCTCYKQKLTLKRLNKQVSII